MKISDLIESKNKKRRRTPNNAQGGTPDAVPNAQDSTPDLPEEDKYSIHSTNKFNKNYLKYASMQSNIKLLDRLIDVLKKTGEITTNNVHPLQEPLRSSYKGTVIDGWKVVWISRTDELRLAYMRFPDGVIEIKFGKPKDIGYKH